MHDREAATDEVQRLHRFRIGKAAARGIAMNDAKLRRVMLECAARLRDALDEAGECPETGSTLTDRGLIGAVAADLEFAARNKLEGEK